MRSLASAAMAGAAAFTVVVLAFHLLRPDLDPALDYISYYAVGRYGALMVAAFVALGLGCVALALAIRGATRGAISLIGCTLLGLAGLGLIVGGIAPSDLEGAPPTTTGAVHVIGAALVGLLGLFVATLVLSVTLARRPERSSRLIWVGLGLLMMVAFLGFATSSETVPGLGQRVLVSSEVLWLLVTAARLRTLAVPPAPGRPRA